MKQGKKLLSIMLAILIAALACGLTGCIKAPGESASAQATQTPDTALSQEPTLDTTPQTTPGDTPDITPGPTPAQSETVQPQDTDAPTPTPAPGDTGAPAPGPTVSHAPVSKWDYYVTYGSASIRTVALTRFNDGTQGGGEGSFTFSGDGLAIKVDNSKGYADTYGIYSGANLGSADYSQVRYVGITVKNLESHDVLFGLQGTDAKGKNVFLYPEGDPIALAYDNGDIKAAGGQGGVNSRYCIVLPAGFSGSVFIPLNRIADSHEKDKAKQWDKTPITSPGFHLSDGGSKGVLVSALFICSSALKAPQEAAGGITNKDYTYTEAQRIAAFWKNSTMYNESITMMKRSSGEIYAKTLFVPTKINAVVDVYLQKEYKEGVDWEWVKGTNKIKWLSGSSIPYFTDNDLSGKDSKGNYIPEFPSWSDGGRSRFGNALYCVSSFLYEKQICISYTYDTAQVAKQGIKYTQYQGDKLKNTVNKLKNGEKLKVLFYGDSIFSGCDASGMYSREPYMPYMHSLIQQELSRNTKGKVQVDNLSVGGWTVENGRDALSGGVDGHNYSDKYKGYDLLILSFGMNNAHTPKEEYIAATKAIVDKIKKDNQNLEVILVSCMNPNPRVGWDVNQKNQGGWLKEIAAQSKYSSYTAVVDFYAAHKSILAYKDFSATTGNNINHPNDWLIRVYAQNILAAMIK